MSEMTTPTTEIMESLRAITVAARERHAALKVELASIEQAFPSLAAGNAGTATRSRGGIHKGAMSAAHREALAASMRQRWAAAKANGQKTIAPAVQ